MDHQNILTASKKYIELDKYFEENAIRNIFLVCDGSIPFLRLDEYLKELPQRLGINVVRFDDFSPNPVYESVVKGVELFCKRKNDLIFAVGGGSAIDVAKCIKLYSNMDPSRNYLKQDIVANDIKLLAMPTTAGTGSEATRYAVIYYGGEKQSVSHESCIPSTVLMDPTALRTLPDYQKKSTMMDALCHAIESFWSVNSADQSKEYSAQAIRLILENKDAYLRNDEEGLSKMLHAANLAGKAINITQTTAGHAMCYKLTSLYGIAHGHAAALCVAGLWPYMLAHTKQCIDAKGQAYLNSIFSDIAKAFSCADAWQAAEKYQKLVESLSFTIPAATAEDFETLANSVNPVRLKNNPVALDHAAIDAIYHQILERKIQ